MSLEISYIPQGKMQQIEFTGNHKCKKCNAINDSPYFYTKKTGGKFFMCEFCEQLSDENHIERLF